jgi:hypothetical protein
VSDRDADERNQGPARRSRRDLKFEIRPRGGEPVLIGDLVEEFMGQMLLRRGGDVEVDR